MEGHDKLTAAAEMPEDIVAAVERNAAGIITAVTTMKKFVVLSDGGAYLGTANDLDEAERVVVSAHYVGGESVWKAYIFFREDGSLAAMYQAPDGKHSAPPVYATIADQFRDSVFRDVQDERANQDAEWGGADHDDDHAVNEWLRFIEHQIQRADNDLGHARGRFVKIAALAVAACESIDRGDKRIANAVAVEER